MKPVYLKQKSMCFVIFLLASIFHIQHEVNGETNSNKVSYTSEKLEQGDSEHFNLKQPAKWFQWGFDFRFRHEYHNNTYSLDSQAKEHEYNYQRYRSRLRLSLLPADFLSFNSRIAWEGREYFKPDSKRGFDRDEALFDCFNLKLGDLTNRNIQLTLGRQEIMFGERWLIFDATSTDGSRTEFFDAARLSIKLLSSDQTIFNLIYFDMAANSERWLPVINSRNKPLSEQDERGGIIYLEKIPFKSHNFDAYFIYKNDRKVLSRGNDGDRFVLGSRAEGMISKNWHYTLEFASQFGTKNQHDFLAFGLNSKIEYLFKDKLNNKLRLGFEYLSGDDPDTDTIEAWDPMWGRRALWSELLVFTFATEDRGRSGEWTNLKRLELGWGFSPSKKTEFYTCYIPLFADENTYRNLAGYTRDGDFRGHFLASVFKFNLTKNFSGHLWTEFFFPGDYYSNERRDLATFYRAQLMYQF